MNPAAGPDRPLRPANRRGAARLAAVQALYQLELGGATLPDVLSEFETYRLGAEVDDTRYREADILFFRDVVTGVVREQRMIDPEIDSTLTAGWPLVRIDATLRAILRCGAYEIARRRDVPVPVVITEYIDIALAFYEGDIPPMVNAVLDALGRKLRPGGPGEERGSDG